MKGTFFVTAPQVRKVFYVFAINVVVVLKAALSELITVCNIHINKEGIQKLGLGIVSRLFKVSKK